MRFFISLTVRSTTTVRMVRNWRRMVALWQFCMIVIAIIRIIFKFDKQTLLYPQMIEEKFSCSNISSILNGLLAYKFKINQGLWMFNAIVQQNSIYSSESYSSSYSS